MYVSAEIRWFWNEPPPDLHTWFCDTTIHDCAVGGGAAREDAYFTDPQTELGIKRRGDGDVEIKGLVDVRTDELVEPFVGPIEIWSKWGAESLTLSDPLILVTKRRRVRQFDTRDQMVREIALDAEERPTDGQHLKEGCNVEYTELSMLGYPLWYTVGFEAFGALASVASNLRLTMRLLATRHPPSLANGLCMSYPVWLSRLVQRRGGI